MTDAERDAIRAAGREAARNAPPLSAEQIEMLRRDNCPSLNRQRKQVSA